MVYRSSWLPTTKAAQSLGITPRQLRALRAGGLFKLGRDYRIITRPGSLRPTYQFNIKACNLALCKRLEDR